MANRKPILSALAVGISACLLSACSAGQNNAGSKAYSTPPKGVSASEAKSVRQKALETGLKNEGKIDVDYLKHRMKPGLTPADALGSFGRNYVEMRSEGKVLWRYDYADTGYQYPLQDPTYRKNGALADVDGLSKGMVHSQLFIEWAPGLEQSATQELYYKASDHHGDHTVKIYKVKPDGTTVDQTVPR